MSDEQEEAPIAGLVDLGQDVSPEFVNDVRKKIYRKTTAAQFAGFTFNTPLMVLLELVGVIVHLIFVSNAKKERER